MAKADQVLGGIHRRCSAAGCQGEGVPREKYDAAPWNTAGEPAEHTGVHGGGPPSGAAQEAWSRAGVQSVLVDSACVAEQGPLAAEVSGQGICPSQTARTPIASVRMNADEKVASVCKGVLRTAKAQSRALGWLQCQKVVGQQLPGHTAQRPTKKETKQVRQLARSGGGGRHSVLLSGVLNGEKSGGPQGATRRTLPVLAQ